VAANLVERYEVRLAVKGGAFVFLSDSGDIQLVITGGFGW
jgi:hypothetical protein